MGARSRYHMMNRLVVLAVKITISAMIISFFVAPKMFPFFSLFLISLGGVSSILFYKKKNKGIHIDESDDVAISCAGTGSSSCGSDSGSGGGGDGC